MKKKQIGIVALGAAIAGAGYCIYKFVKRVNSEEELLEALEKEFEDDEDFEDEMEDEMEDELDEDLFEQMQDNFHTSTDVDFEGFMGRPGAKGRSGCACEHCKQVKTETPVEKTETEEEELVPDTRCFSQDGKPVMRPKSEVEKELADAQEEMTEESVDEGDEDANCKDALESDLTDDGFEDVPENMEVPFEEEIPAEPYAFDTALQECENAVSSDELK